MKHLQIIRGVYIVFLMAAMPALVAAPPTDPPLAYTSPACGPGGGTTAWACGAWASTVPPALGDAGTTTTDPDTGNRVLRATGPGSFGEEPGTAFKPFDGGWKRAWNANSTRFFVLPWSGGLVKHAAYWVGFDPATMSLSGAGVPAPAQFTDVQWDQYDPDVMVGLSFGVAKTYNVVTNTWTKVFDPRDVNWGGTNPWMSVWGGDSVCIAGGGQDVGLRVACYNRRTATSQIINVRTQTINDSPLTVYFQGRPVTLSSSTTIHSINLGQDGKHLAIDTHGSSLCSVPGLPNYSFTALFIDLESEVGYEWNNGCGSTHWAYGNQGVMMQSTSPKWTPYSNDSPCNSDSRGLVHRNTDATIDSSLYQTGACRFYNPATWGINVHLSWSNNVDNENANKFPVLVATTNEGVPSMFLSSDIAAMETSAPPYQGRLWRFAQTWNTPTSQQCGFLLYTSPSISPDGKWAVFPSNWQGQTGSNGVCKNGHRTDLFVFELK